MAETAHERVIAHLQAIQHPTWAERALLGCLLRLASGGHTEGHLVVVKDAFAGPDDSFVVVYRPPWGDEFVAIRRVRNSPAQVVYFDYAIDPRSADASFELEPEVFGANVADWDIGEPLGRRNFWIDETGLTWWGDVPQ